MRFGHEQHPSHQVGGGNALRALTLTVTPFTLHLLVSVFAVHSQGDVVWKTGTTVHHDLRTSRAVWASGFEPAAPPPLVPHLRARRSHSCARPGSPGW